MGDTREIGEIGGASGNRACDWPARMLVIPARRPAIPARSVCVRAYVFVCVGVCARWHVVACNGV